ncbi:YqaE/Pmp3 family membrane protein [Vreelandella andesensis]|uniref:YqaE/Pmp3 family membrane protein n=1 Tax=Vreelandella andesensis TaxID=447567 RepID=A0A3S0W5B5_9GAMM|nr:YqaE/Pmp3 family membrane protein [Halomonas andesensis]RUR28608.1 YqaE/Pmp3 family membrane protein [Halomonas andesensis]
MDAREYLNRKGVGFERDPERPNTLEEKAWERARGSGSQRPKSGTPHDWEDWERHHDDLADGAETLEQKIDKEAHQKALAKERQQAEQAQSAVEHFVPPTQANEAANASNHPTPSPKASGEMPASSEPTSLRFAYYALAVLFPPLSVGLTEGGAKRITTSVVLTLLGWIPGVVHAFIWLKKH